jgi:PAS domain S-box-containing protein
VRALPGQLLITTMNALRRRDLEIAQRKLGQNQEERRQTIIDMVPVAIFARDRDGRYVEANAKAEELGRVKKGEILGRTDNAIFSSEETAGYAAGDGQVLEEGVVLEREDRVKSGPLSGEERSEMERHTVIGHEMLGDSKSERLRLAATIALTHHERFDGTGYPDRPAGEEIPLEGRITAVADVFDALLSERAYRPALPVSEAVALIRDGRGSQFDPEIVDLLLDHLDEALVLRTQITPRSITAFS